MKHKNSVLICELENGIANIYVNGTHCYAGPIEIKSPTKLGQSMPLTDVEKLLQTAANTVGLAYARTQNEKEKQNAKKHEKFIDTAVNGDHHTPDSDGLPPGEPGEDPLNKDTGSST